MVIVDGYQQLDLILLLVLYLRIAQLPQELQLLSAKLGGQHVSPMEPLVSLNQLAQPIHHKSPVETLVLMAHASGLSQLEFPPLELVDYNYVLTQLQTCQHTLDVLHFQLRLLAPPLEQPVFLKPHAHHTQYKLVAFKEQMEFASGQQPQRLQLIQLLLPLHQFADLNYAQIPY